MKIISIKKRNPFVSFFTVEKFKVGVQMEDGTIRCVNAWGGITEIPDLDKIIWDVKTQIGNGDKIESLIGKEL